jgi:2,3,4,5-tetrahydropyridine-2-carboxylate N-succinyltransferase
MQKAIEAAWENRALLEEKETQEVIRAVISQLDTGELRVIKKGGLLMNGLKKLLFYIFQFKKWKL